LTVTITSVDSTGVPDVFERLVTSDALVDANGDGVHPTEFRWSFEPSFAVQLRGHYAFFVRACGGVVDFLARGNPDLYPNGHLWESGRTGGDCLPAGGVNSYPDADVIFQIEFCTQTTPVIGHSWGQLKTVYR
jgi:hypothetical protein